MWMQTRIGTVSWTHTHVWQINVLCLILIQRAKTKKKAKIKFNAQTWRTLSHKTISEFFNLYMTAISNELLVMNATARIREIAVAVCILSFVVWNARKGSHLDEFKWIWMWAIVVLHVCDRCTIVAGVVVRSIPGAQRPSPLPPLYYI